MAPITKQIGSSFSGTKALEWKKKSITQEFLAIKAMAWPGSQPHIEQSNASAAHSVAKIVNKLPISIAFLISFHELVILEDPHMNESCAIS